MHRPAHLLLAGVFCASIAAPQAAQADASADPPPTPVDVDWNAPAECPGVDAVRDAIARNSAGRTVQVGVLARVTVRGEPPRGYVAVLQLETPEGGGVRHLQAPTCQELADVVALIVGLASAPSASAPADREAQVAAPSAGEGTASIATAKTRVSPGKAREPVGPPVASVDGADGPRWTMRIAILGYVEAGALPSPTAGATLSLSARRGAIDVEVQGSVLAPQNRSIEPGVGGRFEALEGRARACWVLRRGAFELGPCGGIAFDALFSRGFGVAAPGSNVSGWAAPEAGGRFAVWPWKRVGFRLDTDIDVPLARPTLVLEDLGTVHRPRVVFGRLGVGVEALLF